MKFSSRILPRYARRSPKVADVLPILPRRAAMRAWKARSGPGVRIAVCAASIKSPRACACPAREMCPCRAAFSPD